MSTDTKLHRGRAASSKRKTRDGSEDVTPARKKLQRKDKAADEIQFEDYGSGGEAFKPKITRKYKDKFAPKAEKEYPSVNDLKKRIRDVKRLLNKMDLSADARILQERALAGYEQDLVDETARRERSHLIKKYHFVRFLDRKTATKELNRLTRREKEQELDAKEKARLSAKIHACRVNLNYTIYYPLTEKYISIYPKSNGNPDAPVSGSESQKEETNLKNVKPPMWAIVAKSMEDNTLDLLREGKLNINADGEKIQAASPGTTGALDRNKEKSKKKEHQKEAKVHAQKDKQTSQNDKNSSKKEKSGRKEQALKKHQAPQVNAEDEDESDGGFFE